LDIAARYISLLNNFDSNQLSRLGETCITCSSDLSGRKPDVTPTEINLVDTHLNLT